MTDSVVVGAGLAGLVAATRLAHAGQSVVLLAQGLGGLPLSTGTVDILGYAGAPVDHPLRAVAELVRGAPDHPYAVIGPAAVTSGLDWLQALLPELLQGDLKTNVTLPTALGALRPTCLHPPSMAAGAVATGSAAESAIAIVGPHQLKDFGPELCAANLARLLAAAGRETSVTAYRIDLPARPGETDSSPLTYARRLDQADYRQRFAQLVAERLGGETVVGLPAVLGLADPAAWEDLGQLIGRPVFEIGLAPPSVPGLRLHNALTAAARQAGVRIVLGAQATGFRTRGDRLVSLRSHQAGAGRDWPGDHFVYAGGGWESGAFRLDSHGHMVETVFGLPLRGGDVADANIDLLGPDYWQDQELFKVGLEVDRTMRPLGPSKQPVFSNLHAVGSLLAGAVRWSELSGEGIAVGSAQAAAAAILGLEPEKGK
ncbi:MAG: glycerol-3-phosphate dehydrogenase subunit GlpB [Propionibacteriaceae bacterium]|jgi:glycerol-3-phosphate dehydrogenase subunit B|nr:glycerol-3-phosphate dehydrogenase subunit GlpB [Propionibacteriaceae bacterium]